MTRKPDPFALRDQAAEKTLTRIRTDRKRVCETLKPALKVIEKRLFDHLLDVNAVWRDSGLAKKSSALFTAQLGQTPGDYIARCRVEVAARLVAGTDLKFSLIADAVGFTPTSDTFLRTFKERTGKTPTAFRLAAQGADSQALEALWSRMDQAGMASAAGDFEAANHCLSQAAVALRDQQIETLSAQLGLVCHERGAHRTREGDVDRAYDDLAFACSCYDLAGDLAPDMLRRRRHVAVSYVTDEALLSVLCADCRTKLASDAGRTLRQHLRRALRLIPRDLEWFEVCCDACYRVVWGAVSRARAGHMDDVWKAWWLSVNADLMDRQTPPSRGRIIAALNEVERLVSGDQLERKGYCDLAVDDAEALGDPLLETQARIWRASVLRAMGELTEARAELNRTAEASRLNPWLTALQDRMAGVLESHLNHWRKSTDLLQSAIALYEGLDPHTSGLVLIQEAVGHCYLAEHAEAVACNEEALSLLDGRRDPLPRNAIVPVNLAGHYALLGDWESADSALSQCRFDRDAHPGWAATEVLVRACLEVLRGRVRESVRFFAEVKERFEHLHQLLDVALAASYSVEAYARLGNRSGAIENAVAALKYFEAAGCAQDTLQAAQKLQALVESEEIDVMAVAATARSLAKRYGGWLPEPE